MIFFWIGVFVLYVAIVFFIHKLFYREVRGDEQSNKRLWKIWGIQTAYWEGALLIGLGVVGVLLYLAKLANLLPTID